MASTNALTALMDQPALDRVAEPLSKAVRGAYEAAGLPGREIKNALHGVPLGHPLHPVFTDVPIGAWTTALALDAMADGNPGMKEAATFAIGVGLVGALGAAVTGSHPSERNRRSVAPDGIGPRPPEYRSDLALRRSVCPSQERLARRWDEVRVDKAMPSRSARRILAAISYTASASGSRMRRSSRPKSSPR